MTIHRHAARRDSNEKRIVQHLTAAGASVIPLSGAACPDLAVFFRGQWFMLEVKTRKGKLTSLQTWQETIDPDAVKIVRTPEEATKAIGATS